MILNSRSFLKEFDEEFLKKINIKKVMQKAEVLKEFLNNNLDENDIKELKHEIPEIDHIYKMVSRKLKEKYGGNGRDNLQYLYALAVVLVIAYLYPAQDEQILSWEFVAAFVAAFNILP